MPRDRLATRALLLALVLVLGPARPATARADVTYRPPVDAPVIDPYRAPTSPYGPGNRGIDYATVPGTVVRAVAAGTVTFAGTVAGSRYVTVEHADGLRSSYGELASISVIEGQSVATGDEVGRAGPTLHLGMRRGEEYLDPESLFGAAPPDVRLIPVADFGGGPSADERGPATQAAGGAIARRLAIASAGRRRG